MHALPRIGMKLVPTAQTTMKTESSARSRQIQYNARNYAAVKFVMKASQQRKVGDARGEGRVGERRTCAMHHFQGIQITSVSRIVLYNAEDILNVSATIHTSRETEKPMNKTQQLRRSTLRLFTTSLPSAASPT
ncbi:hypothetical protein EVAR_30438_1 [Eumeta japonica]|uniref:Uncharacterized protein n=1 Tax=Eumeta variegata TaxID=151549 RepID=A0A4C1W855_EUMVA|nr:hypothetical protein EVAR_30438_1 [Eumeta japonica]